MPDLREITVKMAGFEQPVGSVPYEVRVSSLHQLGVFAKEPVELDEPSRRSVLFEEVPAIFLQSMENRADAIICGHCHGFVGTLSMQEDLLLRGLSRQDVTELEKRSGELRNESDFEDAHVLPVVSCREKCGEIYCSEGCAKQHWEKGHCLLCTGALEEDAPLVQFKIHAMESNEIFLMAADHFAGICAEVDARLSNGVSDEERKMLAEGTAREVAEPYSSFVRNLWWEVALAPEGTDPEQLCSSLIEMVDMAWHLLSDALQLEARGLSNFLSAEYLSRTIGMFEQNNVGVRMSGPLEMRVAELRPGDKQTPHFATLSQAIADTLEHPMDEDEDGDEDGEEEEPILCVDYDGEEEDEEEGVVEGVEMEEEGADADYRSLQRCLATYDSLNLFPPLDGAAFYLNICRINHSCVPNVRVEYVDKGANGGLCAELKVLRPIAQGEELLQSYIEEDAPWAERQQALKDYGFTCSCSKCIRGE